MFKPTPNPPETDTTSLDAQALHAAAQRAMDHYLLEPKPRPNEHRPSNLFVIAPDVDNETLLVHASETLASANVMASGLAFELEGSLRNSALAIQQMISLAELTVNGALDHLDTPP